MAEEKKKQKRPTAEKRVLQTEKKTLANKSFKSRVRTAMNSFQEACKAGDQEATAATLSTVCSLMDKGVKRGIYKINKAGRVKSRCVKQQRAANT